MKLLPKFVTSLSPKLRMLCFGACGCLVGGIFLFLYLLRAHTYLSNDSSACINCHIMSPYYVTWMHSSHARNTTCNDCHVPHDNVVHTYAFKGMDGMKHVGLFLTNQERMSPKIEQAGQNVVMDNCIRCHTELITEMVAPVNTDMQRAVADGKKCWDCHRNIPHGGTNSIASTQTSDPLMPMPKSAVPEWIQKITK
ncbi:MAG: cytochrome c nitrite reductase small subunit [Bacteroidales bacterium]|nr:cytochrome c nitrite reductase small subunit [Bacteroidales bacterium]